MLLQENHAVSCGSVMMLKGSPGGVAATRTVGQSGLQETLLVRRSAGGETQSVGQSGLQETQVIRQSGVQKTQQISQSGLQETPSVGQSGVPVRLTKRPGNNYSAVQEDQLIGQSHVQETKLIGHFGVKETQLIGHLGVQETQLIEQSSEDQLISQSDVQDTQSIYKSGPPKMPATKYFGLPRGRTNCQYCGEAQASIKDKDLHERKNEYREISQVCGSFNCFESFAASCQLFEHSRSQHSVHKLECALCNNIFQSRESLISHMASDHPNRYVTNKEQQKDKEPATDKLQAIDKGENGEITDHHQVNNVLGGQPGVYKTNFLPKETDDKTFDETDHCDDSADENIDDRIIKKENKNVEGMGIDGYSQFLDSLNRIFDPKEDLEPKPDVVGHVAGGGEELRKEENNMVDT